VLPRSTRVAVVRSILAESLEIVAAGLAIGVPLALATTRLLSTKLFGVGPADPLTFGGGAMLIAFVAPAAAFLPARRASRIDPMAALRCE
jgi:putative ABC transport system permease protein